MIKIRFSTLWFMVVLLIVPAYNSPDDSTHIKLVKLVSDFRNTYKAGNVFIARNEISEDLIVTNSFVKLLRKFSRQNVYTTMAKIIDIPKYMIYYKKRVDRSFFIIVIRSMSDFHTFANITKVHNMHMYQILIIFTKNMEICHNPVGNPLNLVFDSKVLVECQYFPIIREWFSLYPNKTEVEELLVWNPEVVGFKKLTNLNFYQRRTSSMDKSLRVTIMEDSKIMNGKLTGFFGKVLSEIAEIANFKIDVQPYEEVPGSYNPKTKKWTGIIGKLNEKKTDIGVSELTVTPERLDIVDFSDPIYITRSNYYVKKTQTSHVLWSMYYKAFGIRACYCLLLILLLSPILLAIIISTRNNIQFSASVCDNYFNVWIIFCSRSPSELPNQPSARIALCSLHILSFMLYSIYSALLVSYLTIFKADIPFNSLEEFAEAKTHKITTMINTTFIDSFKDASMRELHSFLLDEKDLPISFVAAIDQVCSNKLAVVLFMDDLIMQSNRFKIPCEVTAFERGRSSSMGLTFVKDSPYVGLINYHLQRMRSFGILSGIKNQNLKASEVTDITYKPVTVWSTLPIFGILCGGIALAVAIMFCENFIFHANQQRLIFVKSPLQSAFISTSDL